MSEELSADYAWKHPSPAAIKAAGYTAVWRYLSHDSTKNLSPAERDALHAAGLGIGLVWETTAQAALGGAAAGAADGTDAAAQATAIGLAHGAPLLVNVGDFAASGAQMSQIMAYYHAWRQPVKALWQTGGYATGYVIQELVKLGAQGLWWQNAMDDQGVPGDVVVPQAGVYQRVRPTLTIAGASAGDWDEDVTVNGATVRWWRAAAPPPPPPPPLLTLHGYLVTVAGGVIGGRPVTSADGGKTWR